MNIIMKIYIVSFVDLENVGYQASEVNVFTSYHDAKEYIEQAYLKACKKEGIEEPFSDEISIDYGIGFYHAYIFGKYYWDIFDKEMEINLTFSNPKE